MEEITQSAALGAKEPYAPSFESWRMQALIALDQVRLALLASPSTVGYVEAIIAKKDAFTQLLGPE